MSLNCPEILSLPNCTIHDSYIRPDSGDAFIPWIYSLVLLLVHIPSVVVRIIKFESSQLLSILLAIYSVSLTSLEYKSTMFDPSKIYVWTPIALTIDVGAIMHIVSVILEKHKTEISKWIRSRNTPNQDDEGDYIPLTRGGAQMSPCPSSLRQPREERSPVPLLIFCLVVSLLCLGGLVALQIIGMIQAFLAYSTRRHEQFQVPWCSPAFQLGTKIFDRNCNVYPIDNRVGLGIGCIELPGKMGSWLLTTGMIVAFELLGQLVDLAILTWAHAESTFQGVKMKRPWVTMILGLGIWGVLIGAGIVQTQKQPIITGPQLGIVTTSGNCTCAVYPGGLRSSIIAWSDGVFNGWGSLYAGSVPS